MYVCVCVSAFLFLFDNKDITVCVDGLPLRDYSSPSLAPTVY